MRLKKKDKDNPTFPSLIMSLISKAGVKLPSGLPVMSREESISEHTMNWSKAHIPGLERKARAAQVQREEADAVGATPKMRLIGSHMNRKIFHIHLLKHKLEHLTALI